MDSLAHANSEHPEEEKPTKLLGAHVDPELYWEFKKAASARKENLKEAIEHAARMYIDITKEETKAEEGG